MRAIAKRAKVDVALVHYFFGSKSKLFTASVELPIEPQHLMGLLTASGRSPGEAMARYYIEHLFPERRQAITAMLRAGIGDPGAAPVLRSLIERTLVTAAASTLSGEDARLRAELAGAQMIGVFISRCIVGVEPLATASVDQIVEVLGPALDELMGSAQRQPRGGSQ